MTHDIRKIALTGGIASGKSLVGEYLKQQGVPVIDADAAVHDLLAHDAALQAQIREAFGDDVFAPGGGVDRQKLGSKVFNDPERRKLLESWIHPKVRERIEHFFAQVQDKPVGVALIPLVFESGLEKHYDEVWLLETDEETQVRRLMEGRGLSREEALARIRSQMSQAEKRARLCQCPAYALIDNQKSIEALYAQIDRLLSRA